jgi:hypothetical protein
VLRLLPVHFCLTIALDALPFLRLLFLAFVIRSLSPWFVQTLLLLTVTPFPELGSGKTKLSHKSNHSKAGAPKFAMPLAQFNYLFAIGTLFAFLDAWNIGSSFLTLLSCPHSAHPVFSFFLLPYACWV